VARPAVATERLPRFADGRVLYRFADDAQSLIRHLQEGNPVSKSHFQQQDSAVKSCCNKIEGF
jgi:hypothetical protein